MGVYASTPLDPQIRDDNRIDPRIKPILSLLKPPPSENHSTREELLIYSQTPQYLSELESINQLLDLCDDENIIPSSSVVSYSEKITSFPDENTILLHITRSTSSNSKADLQPSVYFIHGGGMAGSSCFAGPYRFWTKLLATKGVTVVSVEFRNSLHPSACVDISPFPGGLNDCVSGLQWLHANALSLNIDQARIVVCGDSGGANLALAVALRLKRLVDVRPNSDTKPNPDENLNPIKNLYPDPNADKEETQNTVIARNTDPDRDLSQDINEDQYPDPNPNRTSHLGGLESGSGSALGMLKGLYLMCPFIAFHHETFTSAQLNDGLLFDVRSTFFRVAYGPLATPSEPLAWPINATVEDLTGLPPVVISLNECDPFLDQGLKLFRSLLAAGVRVRCRQMMGTVHASEVLFGPLMPEISDDTARDIVAFTTGDF